VGYGAGVGGEPVLPPGGGGGVGEKAGAGNNPQPSPLALLMRSAAERGRKVALPGQFLFPRFVSEAEEADIVRFLDSCEPAWKLRRFNGPHRWGSVIHSQYSVR